MNRGGLSAESIHNNIVGTWHIRQHWENVVGDTQVPNFDGQLVKKSGHRATLPIYVADGCGVVG